MTNTYKLVELSDYAMTFQVIQNPSGKWLICFHYFVSDTNSMSNLIDDDDESRSGDIIEKINNANAVFIYSKVPFSQWQYAAESAFDIIEEWGFEVHDRTHNFEVIFWDMQTASRKVRQATSNGLDFQLIPEAGDGAPV